MSGVNLPPRLFAAGEEPIGERVNSYHKIKRTESIIDALVPEELDFIRNSTFGKVIAIEENPPFSGAFGQFVLVRILKVNKKYEFWFLFAGNPVRLSLREFAIVTGLNCGNLPEPAKGKKNPLKEKLFGSLKFCTVDNAIEMLKKKVVKIREVRIKFACLAITSSILFPSSHTPRIISEHVELIRDLDEFLAYPWGRDAYLTLSNSLSSKDPIALSQGSVAIRGYVDAIQLVFLSAVPQLDEEINPTVPVIIEESYSDSEMPDAMDQPVEDNVATTEKDTQPPRYCLIPGHAKNLDTDCQVHVKSIIDDPYEEWSSGVDLNVIGELEDVLVDEMVRLIGDSFKFTREMFKGGLIANDLCRLRGVKKPKEKEVREKNEKDPVPKASEGFAVHSQDHVVIAKMVANEIEETLDEKIQKLLESLNHSNQVPLIQSTISKSLNDFETKLGNAIAGEMKKMESSIIKAVTEAIGFRSHSSPTFPGGPSPCKSPDPASLTGHCDIIPMDINNASRVDANEHLTPTKAADCHIEEVLRDLNGRTEVSDGGYVVGGTTLSTDPTTQLDVNPNGDQVSIDPHATSTEHPVDTLPPPNSDQVPLDVNVIPATVGETHSTSVTSPIEVITTTDTSLNTIEERAIIEEDPPAVTETVIPLSYVLPANSAIEEVPDTRRSKRTRTIPAGLQDFSCDPKVTGPYPIVPDIEDRFKALEDTVKEAPAIIFHNGYCVSSSEFLDIAYRRTILSSGVMDAMIDLIARHCGNVDGVMIFDTSLPVAILKHHSRFVKTALKDCARLKFTDVPLVKSSEKMPERIYYTFNMDKQHWVGVCIDTRASLLHVLDCNTSYRTDSMLKKELNPIATMVPYVLRAAGYLDPSHALKAYTVLRFKGLHQSNSPNDCAVLTVLLIEAHAVGGLGRSSPSLVGLYPMPLCSLP